MKKKIKVNSGWHKHIDKNGISFGASHPANVLHKNLNTQLAHMFTVAHNHRSKK